MDGKFKIFVIVAIVVLAVAIAGSTFFVMKALSGSQQNVEVQQTESEVTNLVEVALGDAILTNIAMESNNIQHYAKVKISIGIDNTDEEASAALQADITAKASSIRSEIIAVIGEQTYTMLSNTTTGKEKLSDEIIARLNKLLDTELVRAVYYEEYFIQ